ncbi:MAG: 2Fe-2S iron-sulfur cluster binding domain-containing protein [Syntrophomonadaceae bacterium]|jgi:NADH-quinone oxidoreductase subunit G|nr:2Fe-2S iron-sulfur cluster binding domain-containing protein [Syntrophomonadaceae bacterium]
MTAITVNINGIKTTVPGGTSILQAAAEAGVQIPTLCFHPDQEVKANCRICVVEVEGQKNLVPACATAVSEGMVIKTATRRVLEARRTILELILSRHPQDCLHCARSGSCELQKLAAEYDVRHNRFPRDEWQLPLDYSTPGIVRDPNKCVLCHRCIEVCTAVQTVNALGLANRGYDTQVVPSIDHGLFESPCVMCGQCIHACPVGAITERDQIDELMEAISDPEKVVVTQIAPAVRLALAEEFGDEPGGLRMEQLVDGLQKIGFDYVLHTNFAADLTIWEEGNELLERLQEGKNLPMFTSCCPGWVRFAEVYYPGSLNHLSTCKSPQQMFGALVKTYWAERMGIDPEKIVSVSIMPCTAKKYEAVRPEMIDSRYADVDLVLTTREIARLFRMTGINPLKLAGAPFAPWMGEYTGAAVLFGASGGVMEAALRTVCELEGGTLEKLDFHDVRGMKGVKEATVYLNGKAVRVAVAHSLSNARALMEQVAAGESPYQFIEVMACPGGCIGGGGQPLTPTDQDRARRMKAVYDEDRSRRHRKAHENQEVKALYEDYLGSVMSHKAHELLHTRYTLKRKNT